MRRALLTLCIALTAAAACAQPRFHVLAFYSEQGEQDHIDFAHQAIAFYSELAKKDGFDWQATTDLTRMNAAVLAPYQLVVWLNVAPESPAQRAAFAQYMQHGGAWLGFHITGYNDADTHWPWFVSFLGAVFYSNSWPPLPALLTFDHPGKGIAAGMPAGYTAPANEWYIWQPDPRTSPHIRVLLTLSPSNYPLGMKDTLVSGDLPVVWTNTAYRMLYMNMGHGDKNFTSAVQNRLFENAILALGEGRPL